MAIAVRIESVIRDKAGLDNLPMLSDGDDCQVLDIQVHRHRDQIRIALTFHNLLGSDGLALQKMQGCRLLAQDQLRTFLLPSLLTAACLKGAVLVRWVVVKKGMQW